MLPKWSFVSGLEMEEIYDREGSLSDVLPPQAALYLWRRVLRVPPRKLRDREAFARWLDQTMQVPAGEVENQRLSHFAVLDRLALQGRGLTASKKRDLVAFLSAPARRRWLERYLRSLGQFAPPLYCGETANLSARTEEHLAGDTRFGRQVMDGRVSPWSELEIGYFLVEDIQPEDEGRAKEVRTLLEMITTSFAVAGYVSRRG